MWKQIYSATNSLSDYKEPTQTNKSQIKQRKNLEQRQNCHKFPQKLSFKTSPRQKPLARSSWNWSGKDQDFAKNKTKFWVNNVKANKRKVTVHKWVLKDDFHGHQKKSSNR